MCFATEQRTSESSGELVQLDLVGIELSGIDARVAKKWPQRSDVAAALAQEAVREAVPKLVR